MLFKKREKPSYIMFRYNGTNIADIEKLLTSTNMFVHSYNDKVVHIAVIDNDRPKYKLCTTVWAMIKGNNQLWTMSRAQRFQDFKTSNKPHHYFKREEKIYNAVQYTGDNFQEFVELLQDTNTIISLFDSDQITLVHPDTGSKFYVPTNNWLLKKRPGSLCNINNEVFHEKYIAA